MRLHSTQSGAPGEHGEIATEAGRRGVATEAGRRGVETEAGRREVATEAVRGGSAFRRRGHRGIGRNVRGCASNGGDSRASIAGLREC